MSLTGSKKHQLPSCLGHISTDQDSPDFKVCHGGKRERACLLRTRCSIVCHLAQVSKRPIQEVIQILKDELEVPHELTGTALNRPSEMYSAKAEAVVFSLLAKGVGTALSKTLEVFPQDRWLPDRLALLDSYWTMKPNLRRTDSGVPFKAVNPSIQRLREDWKRNARPELWYKSTYGTNFPLAMLKDGELMIPIPADILGGMIEVFTQYPHLSPRGSPWTRWSRVGKLTFETWEEGRELVLELFPILIEE